MKSWSGSDVAWAQARALGNAVVVEQDLTKRVKLADRIGDIQKVHSTADVALEQAKALVNSTVGEYDPAKRRELARRIAELLALFGLRPGDIWRANKELPKDPASRK